MDVPKKPFEAIAFLHQDMTKTSFGFTKLALALCGCVRGRSRPCEISTCVTILAVAASKRPRTRVAIGELSLSHGFQKTCTRGTKTSFGFTKLNGGQHAQILYSAHKSVNSAPNFLKSSGNLQGHERNDIAKLHASPMLSRH